MMNPFINEGNLCSNVSINKLMIYKMPTDKVNQNLQGKSAMDIFSTEKFIYIIKKYSSELKLNLNEIEEKKLPQYLDKCLQSSDKEVRKTAEKIVSIFGERLGVILLTLKKGDKENRIARKDWTDAHWDYWANGIKSIIFVGGLSSSKIGERLKYYIEKVFHDVNEEAYNIILSSDSANVGIRGCTTYIDEKIENQKYLIFDFGQTFIKRSIVTFKDDKIFNIESLEKIESKYVVWDFENRNEEMMEALKLNQYLIDTISDTIKSIDGGASNIGSHIVISIANYVRNGAFEDRGGYGKLRLISDDYRKFLSDELFNRFDTKLKVTLIHDGTAMASAFSDYPDSICISLGTVFGVGFPVCHHKK